MLVFMNTLPRVVMLLLTGLLLAVSVTAQEQSVRPGINRNFVNPDWRQWVNTFERPGRELYDRRHEIIEASRVRPGMDIADIGAGTGLHTRLFAGKVAPGGAVYAIDISRTFIDNILRTCREQGITNVKGIVNTPTDIGLPAAAIDLAFIAATYHHFEYPRQTLASLHRALRDDGRVIIIDFRRDPRISTPWVMGHVRGNKGQTIEEMQTAGFRLVDDKPMLRVNYFLEFAKQERAP